MEHSSNKGIILILSILFIVVMMIPITGLIIAPSEIDWLEQPRYELGGLTLNEIFVDNNMKAYYETSFNTINDISDEVYELNGAYYYVQRIVIDTTVVKTAIFTVSGFGGEVYKRFLYSGFTTLLDTIKSPVSDSVSANLILKIGDNTFYPIDYNTLLSISGIDSNFHSFALAQNGNLYIVSDEADATAFNLIKTNNDVTFSYELATPIETLLFDSGNTITPSEMLDAYYLYLSYL